MKKIILKAALAACMFFCAVPKATSGVPFISESIQATMVSLLASMESLSAIANSNTIKMLGNLEAATKKIEAVKKKVDKIGRIYQRGKIVVEMGAMTVSIYSEFVQLVKHIYNNEQFLKIEEIEFFIHLLDYVIFDAVAEQQEASGGKTTSILAKGSKDVAGGALQGLTDMLDWIVEEADESGSSRKDLEESVAKTYQKLSRTARDLRLMRHYAYSYMVGKRYRAGAFDNREYIRYVYYTKYRNMGVSKYKINNW